ncbi:uncharacterized protein [Ptychodera flava]|uniref:uncharacterized protein isoform X2 n=1 Tax=Ptychodera flava TaxID=63121 RepID=UPI00396A1A37
MMATCSSDNAPYDYDDSDDCLSEVSVTENAHVDEEDGGQHFIGDVQGLQPYRFEPSAPKQEREQEQDLSVNVDHAGRVGSTDWCSCCSVMTQVETSHCCQEEDRVWEKVEHYVIESEQQCSCITLHPGFASVCLDRWVLETAYYQYRQEYGKMRQFQQNERDRYIAYRQFVRWSWGFLGRHVRVPLPSCVISKIREHFPSSDGTYKNFQFVSPLQEVSD